MQKFLHHQPQSSAENPTRMLNIPNVPKKCERARQIAQQETNGDGDEEYPGGPRDAVMRDTAFPVYILDRHFAD